MAGSEALPEPGGDDGFKYWCFISYSQRDRDAARRIQSFLEGYALPSGLAGPVRPPAGLGPRIRPVFLDQTHLSASPQLSDTLKRALEQSANLVVLCSPAAAASAWVEDEVAHFRSLGRAGSVFPLILSGEPHASDPSLECLPPSLRTRDRSTEPFLVDLRGPRSTFRAGCLKLVAGLHRLSLDDLVQRHVRRRRRMTALGAAAAMLLAGAVSLAGLRVAADRSLAATLGQARTLEATRSYRAAEGILDAVPGWVRTLAGSTSDIDRLRYRLGYKAGIETLPPLDLEMDIDSQFLSDLVLSGDGRRIGLRESVVRITESVENDWLALIDRATGKRISRLFGKIDSISIVLNRDGTVFASTEKGNILFRATTDGAVISSSPVGGSGRAMLFELGAVDRVVHFSETGPLSLFETSTGRRVASVAARDGSAVLRIGTGDDNETIRHLPVLFAGGELLFVDSISGEITRANGQASGFADLSWVSASSDAVLASTADGAFAYFLAGAPAPLYVTRPALEGIRHVAAIGRDRIAVVAAATPREVTVLDAGDGSVVRRHALPDDIGGLVTLGERALMVPLSSGATHIVLDDDTDTRFELWGQRMQVSTAALDERSGIYALGSSNGSYVVGQADSDIILSEDRLGGAQIAVAVPDAGGRAIELIAGNGSRRRVEILAPRQAASWPLRDSPRAEDTEDSCSWLALSPDRSRIATRTRSGLALFDRQGASSGMFRVGADGGALSGNAFGFSQSGRWIAFGKPGSALHVIDAGSGRHAQGPVLPIVFTPGLDECPARIAELVQWTGDDGFQVPGPEGRQHWRIDAEADGSPRLSLVSVDAEDTDFPEFPPSQTLFVAPVGDREVSRPVGEVPVLRRRSDGGVIATLDHFGPYADRVAFSSDGTRLMIASNVSGLEPDGRPSGGYALIDALSGRTLKEHRVWITDTSKIAFSPDGRFLLANAAGGYSFDFSDVETSADLIDAASGETLVDLTEGFGSAAVEGLVGGYADSVFSADGKTLLGVRYSGRVDVWKLD